MKKTKPLLDKPAIAFVGDYVPRQCGIATFTSDLTEAVAKQAGDAHDVFVVATNDIPEGYDYPERVQFEIRQSAQADYRLAAEFLNIRQISGICVQHEYGIYGGPCGSHLLRLLRRIRRPLVVTLHTILTEPDEQQKYVLEEVGRIANRLVVMTDVAKGILHDVYSVEPGKVKMIPHGIPDVPFVDPTFYKDQFSVEGQKVMLTFGLLSPGKGLEHSIDALPAIVKKHPDFVYIILGATHPHIKRESGEEYRNSLMRRVTQLGMDDHVMFVNRFVSLTELCEYLGSADIYVTPYINEAQITSGTLAYAMGAGKAIVSTPYWYAKEMLAEGRGRLVPFKDPKAIAQEVNDLLDNEVERHAMRKRAYNYCRQMTWNRVAQDYLELFKEAREAWVEERHTAVKVSARTSRPERLDELPETDLRHLRNLTDDTAILQHCIYATPDRERGYATDDVARSLIATAMHWDQTDDENVVPLMQTYLSYLSHAMDPETGRFRDYMNYDRTFSETFGSEDSHARALWGLGNAVALCPHESMIALATRLFTAGLGAAEEFVSPRAWAYTIVGMHAYLRRFGGDSEVRRTRAQLSERLLERFQDNMSDEWPWCEDVVTYANAKLPHALLMSGKWMQRGEMIDVGKRALEWLVHIQTGDEGFLSIVGTHGWYPRGGKKAQFDQQPLEAHAMVDACIEAYHVTRENHWRDYARRAFNWFLGDNDLRTPLYDFTTGGCRDGLHEDRVNENQGAESTLSWLMSLLMMQNLQMEQTLAAGEADNISEQRPVRKAIRPSGPVVATKATSDASTDRDDQ